MTAWKIPPAIGAIVVSIVGAFYVGGPGLGMAVGALAAATIIMIAVRNPPLGEIAIAPAPDARPRLLVVLDAALDRRRAARIATVLDGAPVVGAAPEVLLLAPCRSTFAERWTSDLEPGRERSRVDLARSTSILAELGISVSTRVGEEATVQAVEDTLRSFSATEVFLVGDDDPEVADALQSRLAVPFHRAPAAARAARGRKPVPARVIPERPVRVA